MKKVTRIKTVTKPKCETCVYWSKKKSEERSGFCKRRAPQALESSELDGWVVTEVDEWCGEHHLFAQWLEELG